MASQRGDSKLDCGPNLSPIESVCWILKPSQQHVVLNKADGTWSCPNFLGFGFVIEWVLQKSQRVLDILQWPPLFLKSKLSKLIMWLHITPEPDHLMLVFGFFLCNHFTLSSVLNFDAMFYSNKLKVHCCTFLDI